MTKSQEVIAAEMQKDLEYTKKTVENIERKLDSEFVTREEFDPIKKIVYGMVGIVLTSVFAGLVALVVQA